MNKRRGHHRSASGEGGVKFVLNVSTLLRIKVYLIFSRKGGSTPSNSTPVVSYAPLLLLGECEQEEEEEEDRLPSTFTDRTERSTPLHYVRASVR